MGIEDAIIAYLVIAVWWSTYKLIKANRMIKDLIRERDKK